MRKFSLLYNIEFYYFFKGKVILRLFLRFKPPRKWRKNEAEMQKSSTPKCSFSKETQQNDRQEMDIEHGFSLNLRDRRI